MSKATPCDTRESTTSALLIVPTSSLAGFQANPLSVLQQHLEANARDERIAARSAGIADELQVGLDHDVVADRELVEQFNRRLFFHVREEVGVADLRHRQAGDIVVAVREQALIDKPGPQVLMRFKLRVALRRPAPLPEDGQPLRIVRATVLLPQEMLAADVDAVAA